MPTVDVVVESPVTDSFRVQQVTGMFDVPLQERSTVSFNAELPAMDETMGENEDQWRIGAIIGPSGSGKSTLARRAYQDGALTTDAMFDKHTWHSDRAVIDDFDAKLDGRAITSMLNAVGFSSPPAWVRPYAALSNGEQFRCDLARALLTDTDLVVFDEFTSVVDRQVAQFGSAAVAKAVRAGRARCKQFVAVTCHYDVLEWLEPDWWLDMSTRRLARRWVQQRGPERPDIHLHVRRCGRKLWSLFGRHHYLSSKLQTNARCYAAVWNGRPIGFCATMPLFGQRGMRIVHRLVVLPDYQGLGVGLTLLCEVAAQEASTHRISIVTSHPALIRALARHTKWRCVRIASCGQPHATVLKRTGRRIGSVGRTTASFRFVGKACAV